MRLRPAPSGYRLVACWTTLSLLIAHHHIPCSMHESRSGTVADRQCRLQNSWLGYSYNTTLPWLTWRAPGVQWGTHFAGGACTVVLPYVWIPFAPLVFHSAYAIRSIFMSLFFMLVRFPPTRLRPRVFVPRLFRTRLGPLLLMACSRLGAWPCCFPCYLNRRDP